MVKNSSEASPRARTDIAQVVLDSLASHIAILDENGRIVAVNDAWCAFAAANSGSGFGEGTDYLAVCDRATGACADEAESAAEGIRSVINGDREMFTLEYPCHTPDKERWFLLRVTRFPETTPARVVVSHEDVTAHHIAEAALRQSDRRFRQVAQSNIVGITFWDAEGAITNANDTFLDIVGYTRADLEAGQVRWDDMTPPEWRIVDADNYQALRATARPAVIEKEYLRKDGNRVAVQISASLLEDSETRGLSFIVDITQRRRAERGLRFLAEAGEVLSASLDYDVTLTRVAELVVPHLADWCAVDLSDEGGSLQRVAVTHVDSAKAQIAREMASRYPPDLSAPNGVAEVMRTGISEMVAEISDVQLSANEQDAEHLRYFRTLGFKSYLCVPLMARGRTLGAITLASTESGRRYEEVDLLLAEELAHRVALAVDNARLFQEAKTRAEREALVNKIGALLRGSLEEDEILRIATEEVGRALHVSRCMKASVDSARERVENAPQQYMMPGVAPIYGTRPLTLFPAESIAQWEAGEAVVVTDVGRDPSSRPEHEALLRENRVAAYIACPLFLRGEWVGVFVVHQADHSRAWTDDEISLVSAVADLLALALENARLYARERRVADMLQGALLPNVPDRLGALAIATVYKAGLEESRVGGDFYDAFPLPDGRVALVIADVSGKGLNAAIQTATVKYSLRAFAAESAAPSLVLTRLNRTLLQESAGLGEHFVTLFYGIFDPESGRLTYASAGHETQIIKRHAGGTTTLKSNNQILGISEHRYEQSVEYLGVGDTLVLFTDGLTEARRNDPAGGRELLDFERVEHAVASAWPEVGAGALAAHLLRLAQEWADNEPQDDLALLVARRVEAEVDDAVRDLTQNGTYP